MFVTDGAGTIVIRSAGRHCEQDRSTTGMRMSGDVPSTSAPRPAGLVRNLTVWQAVGLSVALMAPSMAANINPQGTAGTVGRAVPLAFLLAAIGVLLVAYGFVRLCQYFHHARSGYAFGGATLGPRTGLVAGSGLLGTSHFYAALTPDAG